MTENNCLVVRLRAAVDSSSTPVTPTDGKKHFSLKTTYNPNSGNREVYVGATGPLEMKLTNATIKCLNYPDSTTETIVNSTTYRVTEATGTKYSGFAINETDLYGVDVEMEIGTENIGTVNSWNIEPEWIGDNIYSLYLYQYENGVTTKNKNVTNLSLLNLSRKNNITILNVGSLNNLIGTVSQIASIPNKNNITHISMHGTAITGSAGDFTGFSNLVDINASNCYGITGSIEDFVRANAADRPNATDINIHYGIGMSTFNGQPLFSTSGANFDKNLSWSTSGNTVTITVTRRSNNQIIDTATITV